MSYAPTVTNEYLADYNKSIPAPTDNCNYSPTYYRGLTRPEDDLCHISLKHHDNGKKMKYFTRNFHNYGSRLRPLCEVGFLYEDGHITPQVIEDDSFLRYGNGSLGATKLTNLNVPQQLNSLPIAGKFVRGCLDVNVESNLIQGGIGGQFTDNSKSCNPLSERLFDNHIDIFDHLNYNPNNHWNTVFNNYSTWGGESTRSNLRQQHNQGRYCRQFLNPLFPTKYSNGEGHSVPTGYDPL